MKFIQFLSLCFALLIEWAAKRLNDLAAKVESNFADLSAQIQKLAARLDSEAAAIRVEIQSAKAEAVQTALDEAAGRFIGRGEKVDAATLGGQTSDNLLASASGAAASMVEDAVRLLSEKIKTRFVQPIGKLEGKIEWAKLVSIFNLPTSKAAETFEILFVSEKGDETATILNPYGPDSVQEVDHFDRVQFVCKDGQIVEGSVVFINDTTNLRFDALGQRAVSAETRLGSVESVAAAIDSLAQSNLGRIVELEGREFVTPAEMDAALDELKTALSKVV